MCYDIENICLSPPGRHPNEVNGMEETKESLPQQEPQPDPGYTPRPGWQVWGARIGLVLFLILVVLQIVRMAGGWL